MAVDGHHAAFFVQFVRCDQHRSQPSVSLRSLAPFRNQLALLHSSGNQPLFRFRVQRLLQRVCPRIFSSDTGRRHDDSAVHSDFQLSRDRLPISSAERPYFPATSWIRATRCRVAGNQDPAGVLAKQHELGEQAARSQDRPARRCSVGEAAFRQRDRQSAFGAVLADSTRPSSIISTMAFCRPLPFRAPSAGGKPQSWPRISFAYSDDPNSASASEASPASEPRSRTSARPASLEVRADRLVHVLQDADDPEHRRRIDTLAQRLVVEADVAAGDRRFPALRRPW